MPFPRLKHSGDRIFYIMDSNGHYGLEVFSLANGELIQSIESQVPLMLHDFTNDESLFAFEETIEKTVNKNPQKVTAWKIEYLTEGYF